MKNYRAEGRALDFTAPSGGVVSGRPLVIGAVLVVPATTAAEGEKFSGWIEGVYEFDKATGTAWGEAEVIYFNPSTGKFTKTATDNHKAGIAAEAALSAATAGFVRLVPSI
jgi:predicted RecA/RadA family phage recombinase